MPLEDKTEKSGASATRSGASADAVAGHEQAAPIDGPALPPAERPPTNSPDAVVVQFRQVFEENVVVAAAPDAQGKSEAAAGSLGAALRRRDASVAAKAAQQDPTVLQDDQAKKHALWKSLETLHPQVPGYEVLKKLGQGTYGMVWHARNKSTGVEVAIKFFAHGAGDQWQILQAEVNQLAKLHADPGIVQLLGVEPGATPPYFIMDYAEQGSLAMRLEKGPLPVAESIKVFHRVVEALAYVHAKGVRHCDLKPGNILLDARGRPKVADFGQAHLSSDASPALGTFFYMAPEQADLSKQIPDTRWDVYGLGALFYAMVTGRPPREDSTLRSQLEQTEQLAHRLQRYRSAVAKASPVTAHRNVPGMDRPLADIIGRCLEVDPENRYHDANAILEALHRREWNRRQRPLLAYGLIVPLLVLVALGYLGWLQARDATEKFRAGHAELVQSDCKIAAGLIRSVVKSKILEQADRVKGAANNPAVHAALANKRQLFEEAGILQNAAKLGREVPAPHLDKLRDKLSYLGRTFVTWHLTDEDGNSLGGDAFVRRMPQEDDQKYQSRRRDERVKQAANFGTDFSFRQWFNGIRDYNDDRAHFEIPCYWREHVQPAVIITRPFPSKREDKKDSKWLFGLSAPIYLFPPDQVAAFVGVAASPATAFCGLSAGRTPRLSGVLLGTIEMGEFHRWLAAAKMGEGGFSSIYDMGGTRLFHSAFDLTDGESVRPTALAVSSLPDALRGAIVQARGQANDEDRKNWELRTDNYRDPHLADERRYIAGFAPIVSADSTNFGWIAVVQQDYQNVMAPVDRISGQMLLWGLIKLVAGCLLLLGMWAWLRRKLLRPERVVHA